MDDQTCQNTERKKRVTVPELYRKAAKILKAADEQKGSLKNLIYSSGYRVSFPSISVSTFVYIRNVF